MGKKSQITCITYRTHDASDWRVILKGENKHKPVYLGTAISIFCLLWAGVGHSQESDGRKDLRPCSGGEISNCTVNRDSREKRGQESHGGFLPTSLSCLRPMILSLYHFQYCLRKHQLCVFHHREGLTWTSRVQGRHWRHRPSCLSEYCSGVASTLCWCGLG